ncbi:unannotated protein [freshwater metagenome]|uniref:Unannotated protein n=1 Tax=freshwater metagenome TaxID=449393 RepID=A0A6J6XRE2_9ZZZZ
MGSGEMVSGGVGLDIRTTLLAPLMSGLGSVWAIL